MDKVNFASPEWDRKSKELTDQLGRLSELIATERHLVGLLQPDVWGANCVGAQALSCAAPLPLGVGA